MAEAGTEGTLVQLSGKGCCQTEAETLKSGCWWPEEKINL